PILRPARLGFASELAFVGQVLAAHRPDVVHSHAFDAGLIAALAIRRAGGERPLHVNEVHGAVAYESWHRHGGISGALRFAALYGLESLAILTAGRLLLVSDAIERFYPAVRRRPRVAIPRYVARAPMTTQESE